jgi:hypothetical protein
MRIFGPDAARADATGLVTGITSLYAVAAQTSRGLGLGLPSVPREKVRGVNEGLVDLFGFAHFHAETLGHVVTIIAALCGVALCALDRRL